MPATHWSQELQVLKGARADHPGICYTIDWQLLSGGFLVTEKSTGLAAGPRRRKKNPSERDTRLALQVYYRVEYQCHKPTFIGYIETTVYRSGRRSNKGVALAPWKWLQRNTSQPDWQIMNNKVTCQPAPYNL